MSTMPPSLDPMSCRHPMCEIFTCDSFAEPIVQTRVCPCERGVAGGPVSERLCVDIDTDQLQASGANKERERKGEEFTSFFFFFSHRLAVFHSPAFRSAPTLSPKQAALLTLSSLSSPCFSSKTQSIPQNESPGPVSAQDIPVCMNRPSVYLQYLVFSLLETVYLSLSFVIVTNNAIVQPNPRPRCPPCPHPDPPPCLSLSLPLLLLLLQAIPRSSHP